MSQAIVADVKRQLEASGVNLSGNCGAFEIVKRVVWRLRDQGFGLVADGGQTQCQGYSTDVIQNQSVWVDMLGDAGGLNTPVWSEHPNPNPAVWRAPIDPGDTPVPGPEPTPDPPPPAPPCDLSPVILEIRRVEDALRTQMQTHDDANERRYLDIIAHIDHLPKQAAVAGAIGTSGPADAENVGAIINFVGALIRGARKRDLDASLPD